MNVSRRGFLGSVLGTYIATQTPWIGKAAVFTPAPRYRSVLVLDDGTKIEGPRLHERITTPEGILLFIYEPLEIRRTMTVCRNILVHPDGHPLFDSPLSGGSQALFSRDTLKLAHRVKFEGLDRPLQEVIQRHPARSAGSILDRLIDQTLAEREHAHELATRRRVILRPDRASKP